MPHDRVPVAQHNFAFVAKRAGLSMKEFAFNPDKAAQALADAAHDFGYDCIIIDFDTCVLAEAMGATITFPGTHCEVAAGDDSGRRAFDGSRSAARWTAALVA